MNWRHDSNQKKVDLLQGFVLGELSYGASLKYWTEAAHRSLKIIQLLLALDVIDWEVSSTIQSELLQNKMALAIKNVMT